MTTPADPRPHIIVLGGGFAGLTFVQKFPVGLARITVIDRTNHHLFQPLLYQVATAGLAVPDIAQPIRSILSRRPDVTVLMGDVTALDPATKTVTLAGGSITGDYLVVALGGRTSYFGHPEWERFAPGLKSIDDAIRIRREILHAFERAEVSDDPRERRRLLTIVVIGGGPTGVELAGTFAELQRHVLARDFRRLNLSTARVILIEGGPRVLATYSQRLSDKARAQLESLGVTLWLGTRVLDIRAGEVVTDNETIAAANIIWAAGVSASPLGAQLGGPTDRGGRVQVGPDLTVPGRPAIFALGDLVSITDTDGQIVPGTAPAAMQMGAYAARVIARELRAGTTSGAASGTSPGTAQRPPFDFLDKGSMATIGRKRAVAKFRSLEFSGFVAWFLWLFVHLIFLIGFRNKISVVLQWTASYLTFKRGARVIYGFTPPPPPPPPPAIPKT